MVYKVFYTSSVVNTKNTKTLYLHIINIHTPVQHKVTSNDSQTITPSILIISTYSLKSVLMLDNLFHYLILKIVSYG